MRKDRVRKKLIERRDSLVRRRQENLRQAQELYTAYEPDPADVAADVSSARVVERLSDEELMQLQRIGSALARLDEGTYGACVVCGDEIAKARLAVVPEADRCATCTNSH
jgi:DnaK suppressor protein